jgi:hypothetical protein
MGHLGPQAGDDQIDHALRFAAAYGAATPAHAADLGTGGGPPGLVLAALCWPATSWWFIEVRRARAQFLREAIISLGLEGRVAVVEERAEVVGRSSALRGQVDLVTARSFGAPAVVAECAAPLLVVGGLLIVSEPPGAGAPTADAECTVDGARWPPGGLLDLGMAPARAVAGPPSFAVIEQCSPCPDRFPRRAGRPERQPLF